MDRKRDAEKTPLYVFLRQRDEAYAEGDLGRERVLCLGRDGLQMIDILGRGKNTRGFEGMVFLSCFCV